jgi:hypothetical protein
VARGLKIGLAVAALTTPVPGNAQGQVGENRPPGTPLRVSPADGHRFKHGEAQRFTVAVFDPDLDPYTARVTVRDADTQAVEFQGDTHAAPSGVQATAVAAPPLPPGTYTWSARATDVRGAVGPESASATFEVGQPAAAGAGGVVGDLDYDEPGLPRIACAPTSFDVDAQAGAALVDVVVSGFAGPLTLTGSGESPCEDATLGFGTLTLTGAGVAPNGAQISCPVVQGPYTRVGSELVATLTGECIVNGFDTGPLTWTYSVQAVPVSTGAGTTAPITRTTFNGTFAVRSLLTGGGSEI